MEPSQDFKRLYWSRTEAAFGDTVSLIAELVDPAAGSVKFSIFEYDIDGGHEQLGELEASCDGPLATARWRVAWVDDFEDGGFVNLPEFFFEVWQGSRRGRSGQTHDTLLRVVDSDA